MKKSPLRRSPLERGTKPLARRTPLGRGRWHREPSALWLALEAAGIEGDKGIHDRFKYDEEREAAEWQRVYCCPERVAFVRSLRCAVRGCVARDIENHHIDGEGTGRKADWTRIIALCRRHHSLWHAVGRATFVAGHQPLDPEKEAEWTEHVWLEAGEDWAAQEWGDPHHDDPDEDRLLAHRYGGMED